MARVKTPHVFQGDVPNQMKLGGRKHQMRQVGCSATATAKPRGPRRRCFSLAGQKRDHSKVVPKGLQKKC